LMADEPSQSHFNDLGDIAEWIRQNHPQALLYVNSAPDNGIREQYVADLVTKVKPDAFMYDNYPFQTSGTDLNSHFDTLTFWRNKGQQYGVPYMATIQSFAEGSIRLPSESELRMLLFSYLTAGYKGVAYFAYYTPSEAVT